MVCFWQIFLLSSLATIGVPIDDGCIYPSLLHALVASSIENEIYRDFFYVFPNYLRSRYLFAWLKDFELRLTTIFSFKRAHSDSNC